MRRAPPDPGASDGTRLSSACHIPGLACIRECSSPSHAVVVSCSHRWARVRVRGLMHNAALADRIRKASSNKLHIGLDIGSVRVPLTPKRREAFGRPGCRLKPRRTRLRKAVPYPPRLRRPRQHRGAAPGRLHRRQTVPLRAWQSRTLKPTQAKKPPRRRRPAAAARKSGVAREQSALGKGSIASLKHRPETSAKASK